jgi:hypothetical protein
MVMIIDTFAGQNWLITPAALALHDAPPQNIHDQKWLLTLSGVALVGLRGNSEAEWLRDTLILQPTVLDPMRYAIAIHSIPRPAGTEGNQYSLAFQVEQLAPFASISSIFNQGESLNSGFAVDVWRPNHYDTGMDAFTHQLVINLWTGLQVDVAVRDTDAYLYRVGYTIALLGRIVFIGHPETLFRSKFDQTPVGQVPAAIQDVGTANVFGPPRSVIVVDPPAAPLHKWMQISRPSGPDIAGFQGVLTHPPGSGLYVFSATMFLTNASGVASISFGIPGDVFSGTFLHLDFLANNQPDNQVRIDDTDSTEFGSFSPGQPFTVQVTLNINPPSSTAHIVLSGPAASGTKDYTILPPFQGSSLGFGAVTVWQGFPHVGAFEATDIVVARAA